MHCHRCQSEIQPLSRFCSQCGESLLRRCAVCAGESAVETRFCSHCGAPMPAPEGSDIAGWPSLERGTYASERKNVSVLFADLSGSLSLLQADPEHARTLLEDVLDRMTRPVREYGGTVTQTMGDGILAVFGAPLAYEDHAFRACHASLAMQQLFRQEAVAGAGALSIRVGICSGEVVVGERGEGFDLQYSAYGRTAHLGSRIERMAEPGQVLISETTCSLVTGLAEVRPLGPVELRGFSERVNVYELIAISARWQRTQRAGTPLPFMGRDAELALLGQALAEAAAGEGRVIAITGEPGVGKSRLIREFLSGEACSEWRILQTAGQSHNKAMPFQGMAELLAPCFSAEVIDGGAEAEEHQMAASIVARLRELGSDPEAHLPALLSIYGAAADQDWKALPAEQRQRRIAQAVIELVAAESRERPCLIVVNDLQWIDSETMEILARLVRSAGKARVMIVASCRLEYRVDWNELPHGRELPLACLNEEFCELLALALVGGGEKLAPLRRMLVDSSGGNPFFLEESVHALVSSGALVEHAGEYRPARPIGAEDIPPRVQDVIAMRIDRLRPADKRVLQSAAAVGYEVEPPLLAAVLEVAEDDLVASLARLAEAQFLIAGGERGAAAGLKFKHPLTHDVAYNTLISEQRRHLHRRIVCEMEQDASRDPNGGLELLAFHAERAEEAEKAFGYFEAAGDRALSRSAYSHAIQCFEQALALAEGSHDWKAPPEAEIDLRLEMRNALFSVGRHGEILPHLRRAEALSSGGGEERRHVRALSMLSHYFWLVGDWANAITEGRRAVSAAGVLNDLGLMVTTRFFLGLSMCSTGNFDEAIETLGFNARALTGDRAAERFGMLALPSVVSRGFLAWCLAERGEFEAAYEPAFEAKAIAQRSGHAFDQVQGYLAPAQVFLLAERHAEAIEQLEPAVRLCEKASVRVLYPRAAACLGYAYAVEGRLDDGLRLVTSAVEASKAINLAAMRGLCLRWAGEVRLLAGDVAEALDMARELHKYCRASGEAGNEAWALCLLGSALAQSGARQEAEHALASAIGMGEKLEMLPLVDRCRARLREVRLGIGVHAY